MKLVHSIFFLFLTSLTFSQEIERLLYPKTDSEDSLIYLFKENPRSKYIETIEEYYQDIAQKERLWPGLQLTSAYRKNFNELILDEENLNYNQSLSMGLKWNLLKDGFIESLIRQEEIALKKETEILKTEKEFLEITTELKRLKLEQLYINEIAYWKHVNFVICREIYKQDSIAYTGGAITRTESQISHQRYKTAEQQENIYRGYNDDIETNTDFLVFFNINSSIIEYQNYNLRTKQLQAQNEALILKKNKIKNEMNLSTNLNYNIYERATGKVLGYVSAGVNFNMPVNAFYKTNPKLEIEYINRELEIDSIKWHQKIYKCLHDQNKLFQQLEEYKSEIINIENVITLKRGTYHNIKNEYNSSLLSICEINIKMCELKKESLYNLLLLYELFEGTPIDKYLIPNAQQY